jgi:hypothetical protein
MPSWRSVPRGAPWTCSEQGRDTSRATRTSCGPIPGHPARWTRCARGEIASRDSSRMGPALSRENLDGGFMWRAGETGRSPSPSLAGPHYFSRVLRAQERLSEVRHPQPPTSHLPQAQCLSHAREFLSGSRDPRIRRTSRRTGRRRWRGRRIDPVTGTGLVLLAGALVSAAPRHELGVLRGLVRFLRAGHPRATLCRLALVIRGESALVPHGSPVAVLQYAVYK